VRDRHGRIRKRPKWLAGDKGYSCRPVRRLLRRRGIRAVIPERSDQIAHRKGRPPAFDQQWYRSRSSVEQGIGWLKEHRAVATRHDKTAVAFQATVNIAIIRRYLRLLASRDRA